MIPVIHLSLAYRAPSMQLTSRHDCCSFSDRASYPFPAPSKPFQYLAYERVLARVSLLRTYLPVVFGRNVYFIRKEDDGTWTRGSIISDRSVAIISFTENVYVSAQ